MYRNCLDRAEAVLPTVGRFPSDRSLVALPFCSFVGQAVSLGSCGGNSATSCQTLSKQPLNRRPHFVTQ